MPVVYQIPLDLNDVDYPERARGQLQLGKNVRKPATVQDVEYPDNLPEGAAQNVRQTKPVEEKITLVVDLGNGKYWGVTNLSSKTARDITGWVYNNATLPSDQLEKQLTARSGEQWKSISTLPPGAQPVPNLRPSNQVDTLNPGPSSSSEQKILRSPALSI